ncbi:MAG TPA: hypothetical protein VFQ38_11385, partial [Longimicrobiales bacterium]|nr:hypothetical protein [Longimicrobiales bacterium]
GPTAAGDGAAPGSGSAAKWLRDPPRDLFGLALSGGGIRSATFNLGLLQGLAERGILGCFDYLSTVSGGGYVGGFWTAWRRRDHEGRGFPRIEPGAPGGPPQPSEPAEIRHLREFGNFLNPRLGILSFDTGRMVAALFAATLPSLLAAGALIALAVAAWLVPVWALFAPPAWLTDALAGGVPGAGRAPATTAGLILLTTAVLFGAEAIWRRKERLPRWPWAYAALCVVALTVVFVVWLLFEGSILPFRAGPPVSVLRGSAPWDRVLFLPPVAWLAGAVALVVVRFAVSAAGRRGLHSPLDRVLSRLVFLAALWMVVTALWLAAAWVDVHTHTLVAWVAGGMSTSAIALVVTRLQGFFAPQPNKPAGSRIAALLRPRLPQLVAYAFVALLVVLVMYTMLRLAPIFGWVVAVAAGITALVVVALDPNEVGLHAFYRGRIARAFLGAAHARDLPGDRVSELQREDDVQLGDCRQRPLHLVCCAANDLAANEQFLHLHRGADSAVLSPVGFSVGGEWSEWPAAAAKRATALGRSSGVASLADAVTASAAAFNSQMGSWSVRLGPAAVFSMTALNLRLGMWWRHPEQGPPRRWTRGLPFYKEMLGLTRAAGTDVHLSDGGHFENMALYELIRRHCRYIVASDCGADPDVAFDDLGNLVRRVREDFDVEITIDLTPLRPGPDGHARQPMVAGDIAYPDGDSGVLLLFKPTLVGDEPADVGQYRTRNAAFPHESTGDQFYDEAQWESYRRLGEHAALSAFRFVGSGPDEVGRAGESGEEARARCARHFARARFEWTPPPPGFGENVQRIAEAQAALEHALRDPKATALERQVYREVAALEGAPTGSDGIQALLAAGPILREAIRHMEALFHLADLGRYHNHPLNLGIMNSFGRWVGAPLFRHWWPLLRPLYAAPFAGFLETQFGLQSRPETRLRQLRGDPSELAGLAWDGLRAARGAQLNFDDYRFLAFEIRLAKDGPPVVQAMRVQAAILAARETTLEMDGRRRTVIHWDARDFFVPAGLWGIGIGDAFLRQLTSRAGNLLVQIPAPADGGRAARKTAADLAQMYRSAGFADLSIAGPGRITAAGADVSWLEPLVPAEEVQRYRWLLRPERAAPPVPPRLAAPHDPAAELPPPADE